ncbi:MAG: nucleotidyltransferase family protein [Eubacterium sp.]
MRRMKPTTAETIGVVAEFDPFHEGHVYLAETAKKITGASNAIAVMSGPFTQRGTPAVFDKWKRAEDAVRSGAYSLVIELPAFYAVSSAGTFAAGGVKTLKALGCVDTIAFGSESGDSETLRRLARCYDSLEEGGGELIRKYTAGGVSYPAARQKALEELLQADGCDVAEAAKEPNNILAAEYIRAAGDMPFVTVKRSGAGHAETSTALRKKLAETDGGRLEEMSETLFNLVRAVILSHSADEIERIASAGEGISNRLKSEVRHAGGMDDLISRVKSKRYTYSRISRLLIQLLLGIEKKEAGAVYIRPLAFDERGAALLRRVRRDELNTAPVIDSVAETLRNGGDVARTLAKDVLAEDIYSIITGMDLYRDSDFVRSPVYVK